ncbi:1-acyl-sn-glycerol-3-phosphate acyltransferase [Candidatus Woesearchaeota archaeon]|nr:1-acyl-sn-glycerol-3-phosphate acyltransferase [Candidatus Woesearchaeota archaeon]
MVSTGVLTANAIYYAGKAFLNTFLRPSYKAAGKDALPEKDPFVLLGFHDHWVNIPEDANLTGRRVCFIHKYELLGPFFRQILYSIGSIPLKRDGSNMHDAYSGLERAVKEGAGVAIYPEGTRNLTNVVGKAGALANTLAQYLVSLSSIYGAIHFIGVGRSASWEGNKRKDVTIKCEELAVATNGKLLLTDKGEQDTFEKKLAIGSREAFDFFLNGYVMPVIASLSTKQYNPSANTFVRNMIRKRRLTASPQK